MSKNRKPLLSIVIPTKNRYFYLQILIQKLLKSELNSFEIIIQDNTEDNSEIIPFITKNSDKRLIYNHISKWLSVVDNCDIGISNTSGEFVCMLGDDDGILVENSISLLEYLSKNNVDAAIVNKLSYAWPDNTHLIWKSSMSGKLNKKKFSFSTYKRNTKKELEKVINQGAAMGILNLPRVYHGFVTKTKLDLLKAETGTYFPGPSPDMANAIGITKFIESYYYLDFPLIISGHCKKSTGGQGGMKKHVGKVENQPFLPKDTAQKWSQKIPFFWSGPTIYAESARRALKATNRDEDSINYNYLYACCFVYERSFINEVNKTILKQPIVAILQSLVLVPFYTIILIVKRTINFLKNYLRFRIITPPSIAAENIGEAIDKLNSTFGPVSFK